MGICLPVAQTTTPCSRVRGPMTCIGYVVCMSVGAQDRQPNSTGASGIPPPAPRPGDRPKAAGRCGALLAHDRAAGWPAARHATGRLWHEQRCTSAPDPVSRSTRTLLPTRVHPHHGCNRWKEGLDIVVEGEAVRVTDEVLLRQLADGWSSKYDGDWQYEVRDGAFHHEAVRRTYSKWRWTWRSALARADTARRAGGSKQAAARCPGVFRGSAREDTRVTRRAVARAGRFDSGRRPPNRCGAVADEEKRSATTLSMVRSSSGGRDEHALRWREPASRNTSSSPDGDELGCSGPRACRDRGSASATPRWRRWARGDGEVAGDDRRVSTLTGRIDLNDGPPARASS